MKMLVRLMLVIGAACQALMLQAMPIGLRSAVWCAVGSSSPKSSYVLTVDPSGGVLCGEVFGEGEGGDVPVDVAVVFGKGDNSHIGTATLEGHTFNGWYDAGGSQVFGDDGCFVEGGYWDDAGLWQFRDDLTVYAHWTINKYNIAFDANGGEGGTGSEQDYGTEIVAPTVTRVGYTFVGWSPEAAATVPASNVTYTAQWQINKYTVTFDANGGAGGTRSEQDYGTEIVAPTVTRVGYTFIGWSPDVAATVPANDVTYVAQWQINRYKVTFNANGGAGGVSGELDYGSELGTLPTPTRQGYTFEGWWTAAKGGEQVAATATVSGDATYYAHWTANTYGITLDLQGGRCESATVFTMKYGSTMSLAASKVPSRYGYVFQGYFSEPDGAGVKYYNADGTNAKAWDFTEDSTLYAHWVGNGLLTVVLHKNDGTGTEHALTAGKDKDTLLPGGASALKWAPRRGFSFMGWSTEEKSKVVAFKDKANVRGSFEAGKVIDLYAIWQLDAANAYAIQYIRNDGSGKVRTIGFKGSEATKLNSVAALGFARRGYDFIGWAKTTQDARDRKVWKKDMEEVVQATKNGNLLRIYAIWTLKPGYYSIYFHKNDAVPAEEKWRELGYEYDTDTTLPTVAAGFGWTREGYTFVGWATSRANAEAGKIWRGDAGVTRTPVLAGKTLHIYAVWRKDDAGVLDPSAVCTGEGCVGGGTPVPVVKTVQAIACFADGDSQPVEARIESDGFTVVELGGSAYCGYVSDGVGELLGPDGSILLVVIAVE